MDADRAEAAIKHIENLDHLDMANKLQESLAKKPAGDFALWPEVITRIIHLLRHPPN